MLPEASAEGNIPTKGEQHACYMAEHLTIDLLYHYHTTTITTTILCLSGLPDRSTIILDGSYTLLSLDH